VQKVLPKLAGGRELDEPLGRLLSYCLEGEVSGTVAPDDVLDQAAAALGLGEGEASEPVFPRAARKLFRMLQTLRRTGFVAALQ
jgi:hypothetical protein